MKLKNLIYIFVFIIAHGVSKSQVIFEAKVSKEHLGINERLRVDFEMNQDGDNFIPPSFKGFRVLGSPNQSISNSWINGKRSYSKTFSYFIEPQQQGRLTIEQASIEVAGKIYKTTPVQVRVTEAVEIPLDPNDPNYLASKNVHLVAEVSNSNPYLNESITITYKLYVSEEVSITSNWRELDTPKFADFWSQNIDTTGEYKIYNGKYKGENYRYVILRRTVLYPQKTGKLSIAPLTLDIPINVKSKRRNFFGQPMMTRVNKTISAGKRTIQVKPLPNAGRPGNFTGAVGDFKFDVISNKKSLDANESLEISVRVSGLGNLKLFDLPKLKIPSSLEMYEPSRSDDIRTQYNGMSGAISENYTVVPQFKGSYPIRPLSFSYFNPKTKKYHTLSSKEILIEVVNGPLNSENYEDERKATTSGKVEPSPLNNGRFKYIKLNPNLHPITKKLFFKSSLFWILLGSPLLLIPLVILGGRKRKQRLADSTGNKLRKANRLAKKYLGEAKKNLANKTAFYESLERALHNYLKAKLNIETSEMSKSHISTLLSDKNVQDITIETFLNLLKSCELARYTPTSNVTIQKDYQTSVKVISDIDKQFS